MEWGKNIQKLPGIEFKELCCAMMLMGNWKKDALLIDEVKDCNGKMHLRNKL